MVHLGNSSLSEWEKETTMISAGASNEKKKRLWETKNLRYWEHPGNCTALHKLIFMYSKALLIK